MPSELQVSLGRRAIRTRWDGFVNARDDVAGYHAWGWRRVFANAFGHEPVYLIARRDGEVAGTSAAGPNQEPAVRQFADLAAISQLRRRHGRTPPTSPRP